MWGRRSTVDLFNARPRKGDWQPENLGPARRRREGSEGKAHRLERRTPSPQVGEASAHDQVQVRSVCTGHNVGHGPAGGFRMAFFI